MSTVNYDTTCHHGSLQGTKGAWRRALTLPGQEARSHGQASCPSTQQVPSETCPIELC